MENLIGKKLGQYEIESLIGKGGMAAVYKAHQPSMSRHVAIKILPPEFAENPQFVGRFKREARVIANLEHAHILPVYDFGEAEGHLYIVMRLVETGTLNDRLSGKPFPLEEIRRVMTQVGSALDYAHSRGVIHRDIKPNNILIDQSGNCLLADFGIAKAEGPEQSTKYTQTGSVIGTPAYMSPEQGLGEKVDSRTDLYALGIVLYQMATGEIPYSADTPMAVMIKHIQGDLPSPRTRNPTLSLALEAVITKSVARQRDERYATAGELARDLGRAIDTGTFPLPASATHESPRTPVTPYPSTPSPITGGGFNVWTLLGIGGGLASLILSIGIVVIAAYLFTGNRGTPAAPITPADTQRPLIVTATTPLTDAADLLAATNAPTDIRPTDTAPPPTAPPETKFDIAFTSDHDGPDAIYLMDSSGADREQITDPDSPIQDWWPTWCGKNEILFERGDHQQGSNSQTIHTVNLGQPFAERQWAYVPSGSSWSGHPICSRDGRYVSFTALYPGDQYFSLWLADLSSGSAGLFGNGYQVPGSMDFSPDGNSAVFSYFDNNSAERQWVLYTVEVFDPYNLYNILPSGVTGALFPAWSPDGRQIAFACRVGEWGLCVTDTSGSYYNLLVADLRLQLVERDDIKFNNPTWSPDGKWIAFASDADGDWDIYVIRSDGAEQRNLTNDWSSNEFYPAWNP